MTSPNVILQHLDWDKPFEIHTDASKRGVGAMLAQQVKGELKPVRFASRAFSETESRWHTMQFELYAIKWALDQFRPYVLGKRTKIVTDHANLKWLTSVNPQQSKLARWCLSMGEYDFYIEHKPGRYHVVPDTLSRLPVSHAYSNLVFLPDEVDTFLTTTLALVIPFSTPGNTQEQFFEPFKCISLACLPIKNSVHTRRRRIIMENHHNLVRNPTPGIWKTTTPAYQIF